MKREYGCRHLVMSQRQKKKKNSIHDEATVTGSSRSVERYSAEISTSYFYSQVYARGAAHLLPVDRYQVLKRVHAYRVPGGRY